MVIPKFGPRKMIYRTTSAKMEEQAAPIEHPSRETLKNKEKMFRVNFVRTLGRNPRFTETNQTLNQKTRNLKNGKKPLQHLYLAFPPSLLQLNGSLEDDSQHSQCRTLVPGPEGGGNRADLIHKELCLSVLTCLGTL